MDYQYITVAYLNGELEEEVFMKRPEYIEEILERITKREKRETTKFSRNLWRCWRSSIMRIKCFF